MVHIMKMTKEHIDTINELLAEHGEGIRYGMKWGILFTTIGVGIGASINYVSYKIKNAKSDKEIES